MNYINFIRTFPEAVRPHLSGGLRSFKVHQPFRWIIQMHYGEQRLHYEVGRIAGSQDLELAFHCEAKDKALNRYLLKGFRRHLVEIRDTLGDKVEAEMWDRGWTKIYERFPGGSLTEDYQAAAGRRLAEFITCVHPFFISLRQDVMRLHR